MRSHRKYFEERLRDIPVEKLWKIAEVLLMPYHVVPDKTLDYEHLLELCILLKEADELFGNLAQVALLKNELDNA